MRLVFSVHPQSTISAKTPLSTVYCADLDWFPLSGQPCSVNYACESRYHKTDGSRFP